MEKFIPYEKLSKKEKRKIDAAKRGTWGDLNPVTRKPQNSKAYNRRRTRDWKKEYPDLRPCFFCALDTCILVWYNLRIEIPEGVILLCVLQLAQRIKRMFLKI